MGRTLKNARGVPGFVEGWTSRLAGHNRGLSQERNRIVFIRMPTLGLYISLPLALPQAVPTPISDGTSQDTALSRRRPRVRIPHTLPRYGKCKAPPLAIPMMLIVTAVGADITSGSQKRPFANRIFGFWTTGSSANVSPGPE